MAAATGFSSGRAAGNMLRSRGDWRLAALQGMAAGLPSLSEAQLGAAMVAAVKLELQPPVQWVQVRGKRGCGYHSAVGPPGSIGGALLQGCLCNRGIPCLQCSQQYMPVTLWRAHSFLMVIAILD